MIGDILQFLAIGIITVLGQLTDLSATAIGHWKCCHHSPIANTLTENRADVQITLVS